MYKGFGLTLRLRKSLYEGFGFTLRLGQCWKEICFSFTSHAIYSRVGTEWAYVFQCTLAYWMKHLTLTLSVECLAELNCSYFACRMGWSSSKNKPSVQTMRLLITKRSGGQLVSRTFRCSSTMPRQTTYYRRLGRSPVFLDDSKSDAFSRMLQTFRISMAAVHTAATKQRCCGS